MIPDAAGALDAGARLAIVIKPIIAAKAKANEAAGGGDKKSGLPNLVNPFDIISIGCSTWSAAQPGRRQAGNAGGKSPLPLVKLRQAGVEHTFDD
jgi:hypothetical protein